MENEITRLEIFLYLAAFFVPVMLLLAGLWEMTKPLPPMATYTKPRAERRPDDLTADEQFEEACRRG